jgi:AcrR family transcriptional regulator
VELVLSVGIDSISFRDVGRIAGLTHGALYARFEDVEELLVDLWNEVLRHRAIAIFDVVLEASVRPSEDSVRAVFDFVRDPPPTDAAMVQVLLTSRRFEILQEEVDSFVHDYLDTTSVDISSALQSRALTLFSLVIVQVLAKSQFGASRSDISFLERVVLESLTIHPDDVSPAELHEPNDRIIPAPKNDLRSQLAYYTFGAVGKSGYTRATISRISRRANCSPGAIYKLYPSKEDLIIEAIRRVMEAPWITVSSFADILEEGNLTQLLYSAASSQNNTRKSFTLEVALASFHSEKLQAAVQNQLQGLEAVVPLLEGLTDNEKNELTYMIRTMVLLTLGVSFLSTVTKATDLIDFNQFAEPLRRTLANRVDLGWTEVRRQLQNFSSGIRRPPPEVAKSVE